MKIKVVKKLVSLLARACAVNDTVAVNIIIKELRQVLPASVFTKLAQDAYYVITGEV